jgi:hypothetical protein
LSFAVVVVTTAESFSIAHGASVEAANKGTDIRRRKVENTILSQRKREFLNIFQKIKV